MTRDDIIRMAREAGFANVRGGLMDNGELSDYWDCWPSQLERFAALAAAAEREVCARVCVNLEDADIFTLNKCASAIRARGNT